MDLNLLTAISPIDGRYRSKTDQLGNYFSEYALIRYRVRVEIEYFITLCELPLPQLEDFNHSLFESLRDIYRNFSEQDAQRVKDIEKVTNHDVKAVEYFIKEQLDKIGDFEKYKEFIHFGLTSQDINNTSVPLSIKEALAEVIVPQVEELIGQLNEYADAWAEVPMLAKTHGQPASPTRLGKEIRVFSYRLQKQLEALQKTEITAKFGGATGNFNAHHVAYPKYDWREFGNKFVSEKLGLEREQYTTQISNYDQMGAVFDALRRINTIIIDLDREFECYAAQGEPHRLREQRGKPRHFERYIAVPGTEIACKQIATRPHRLNSAAQCGRASRSHRYRNTEHTEGSAQTDSQRGETERRSRQHLGGGGRGNTDHTAP